MTETAVEVTVIETVMIVDDDRFDQMLSKRVLERSGMVRTIIQFQSPEQAVAYLAGKNRPNIDIILLDIIMPRMNGFEFLEAATRDCGPDFACCVVVMLTTSLDPMDLARAKQFSMIKDYFSKPLELADVPKLASLL